MMNLKARLACGTLLGALLLTGCSDDNNSTYIPPISGGPTLAPPTAVNDSYSGRINAQISPAAATGVLANDVPNTGTIVSHTDPSHGAVTLNADGSFTYTPTTGYAGTDTFTYTLQNTSGNATATVTLTLAGTAIFVNNQAASGGDGSQAHPYSTLAAAVTAASGIDGAQIVVAQGDGTSTGLNTAVTLTSNQSIVGLSASAQPTLTGPINFTQGNSLSNLRIIGTTGTAVNATGAANGTLTGVTIANTTGHAIDLSNATGIFAFAGGAVSNIPVLDAVVANSTAGNLTWSLTNSTFTNNTLGSSSVYTSGVGNQSVTFSNNTYISDKDDSMYFQTDGNSTLAANVTNNTVSGGGTALHGVDILTLGNGLFLARILANNIAGCRDSGVEVGVGTNSTGKIRFEDNSTIGNGLSGNAVGVQMSNAGTAQIFTTFTNNTSDQYNLGQSGSMNFVVENLAAFTTNNTGTLSPLGNVVTSTSGDGIP